MLCGKREHLKRSSRDEIAAEKFRNWFLVSFQMNFSAYCGSFQSLFDFGRQIFRTIGNSLELEFFNQCSQFRADSRIDMKF